MPKILRQNVGGIDYAMAGCALSGSCATAASDFVKVVTLSDGDTVSDGMTVVVAFANGNTAGNAPIPMTIYSSDQVHYFSDSGLTQPFTLAPSGCYTITYTGTGNAYDYISYPVLQVGSVSGPLCDASGKEASGSLWLAGDKVSINYANGCFSVIPQTTSFLAVMAASSVVNGAPVRIGGTLRVLFTQDLTGAANAGLVLTYNGADVPVMVGKNGSLSALLPFDIGGGTYKYLQAYTTLELMYDGTQFIIIGNPVVLSGTDFTIYADGLQRVNTVAADNKGMVTSGGVASAIKSLDVPSVGGSGKYISAISETDGKISATASDITSTVSSGNSQPVTSGGVADAIGKVIYDDTITDCNNAWQKGKTVTYTLVNTVANLPTNESFYVISQCNSSSWSRNNYVTQIATCADNVNKNIVYTRHAYLSGGAMVWTSWVRLVKDTDLTSAVTSGSNNPITSGGVYNLDTFPLTRFIVNVAFDSTIYSAGTNITAQQLVNFLKQKGYITSKKLVTGYDGVHLILNFVNSIASQWKFDNVGLRCAWIEFEGAFISLDSTSSEERWIMKIHTVETKAEYVVFKLPSNNPATYKVGLTAI